MASEPDNNGSLGGPFLSAAAMDGLILVGKSEQVGGGHLCRTRELIIPMLSYREFFTSCKKFTSGV